MVDSFTDGEHPPRAYSPTTQRVISYIITLLWHIYIYIVNMSTHSLEYIFIHVHMIRNKNILIDDRKSALTTRLRRRRTTALRMAPRKTPRPRVTCGHKGRALRQTRGTNLSTGDKTATRRQRPRDERNRQKSISVAGLLFSSVPQS